MTAVSDKGVLVYPPFTIFPSPFSITPPDISSIALPAGQTALVPAKQADESGLGRIVNLIVGYLEPEDHVPDKDEVVRLLRDRTSIASQSPYQLFWGLGESWWKQIIDGKFHPINSKMVFDLGLHKGAVEPGFIEHCENACKFLSRALLEGTNKLTVDAYRRINVIACKHFRGAENGTIMIAAQAGQFHSAAFCRARFHMLFPLIDKKKVDEMIDALKIHYKEYEYDDMTEETRVEFLKKKNMTHEEYLAKLDAGLKEYERVDAEINRRIEEINKYIAKRSQDLKLESPVAILRRQSDRVYVYYHGYSSEKIQMGVDNLFKELQQNMAAATSPKERIRCIADLFQMLEWLHPFRDGQGRTDLILLAVLLCHYGFNPAILEEPYVSTYATLDEWAEYLTAGIEKWQDEYERIRAPFIC